MTSFEVISFTGFYNATHPLSNRKYYWSVAKHSFVSLDGFMDACHKYFDQEEATRSCRNF